MDKRSGHYYFFSGKSKYGALKVSRELNEEDIEFSTSKAFLSNLISRNLKL